MNPWKIGFIGFGGVASVDLSGPAEAFSCVRVCQEGSQQSPGYEILMMAASNRPFAADCGLIFKPHTTFADAPELDTIIIPGGMSLRDPAVANPISDFIRARASQTRRIVSLCSGVYGLAATGLLGGRKVTTHWRYARDVAMRFPNLHVEQDTLFTKDGKFYTSAGASAGIDLALFLIEEDYGPRVSLSVARELVVYLKRPGHHEQYSEPLQFQTSAISRLSEMTTWILSHLNEDLSVEKLAARACLCPRQFGRRFKVEVGSTPAEFVEKARIEEARRRLCQTSATIQNVAISVGFRSSDVFRRRFEQRVGITPGEFRRRFSDTTATAFTVKPDDVPKTPLAAA
jgi:transcriptional regulator GlxA family with amidase domain